MKNIKNRSIPEKSFKQAEREANKYKFITLLIIDLIFFISFVLISIYSNINKIKLNIILILLIVICIIINFKGNIIYNCFLRYKLSKICVSLVDTYLNEYNEVIPLFINDNYHIDYINDLKKRAKFFAILSDDEVYIKIKYNETNDYLIFETLHKKYFFDNYEFKKEIY